VTLCFDGLSVVFFFISNTLGCTSLKNIRNIGRKMEGSHYWILKKMNGNFGTGCVWLIKETADCCCEHHNERFDFQIMQSISWLAEEMPPFGAGVRLM
jgi:hypothetical protein